MLGHRTVPESTIELATTRAELEAASRLVHDRYVERGYMKPHPTGTRVTSHQALLSTRVFVARQGGRVVATVSIVEDSPHGLPCDALYRPELAAMRVRGERLVEVSALAVAEDAGREGSQTVRSLIEAVAAYAMHTRLDALVITVNPRHAAFYERGLGFERFGPVRSYDAVGGAPAVPLRLDLRRALAAASGDEGTRLTRALLKSLHSLRHDDAIRPRRIAEVC